MIRLAGSVQTDTSPEFTWPNLLGTSYYDATFNHSLGVTPDRADLYPASTASFLPNCQISSFSEIAGTYYGYNVVVCNETTVTIRCYRQAASAIPAYIAVYSFGATHL